MAEVDVKPVDRDQRVSNVLTVGDLCHEFEQCRHEAHQRCKIGIPQPPDGTLRVQAPRSARESLSQAIDTAIEGIKVDLDASVNSGGSAVLSQSHKLSHNYVRQVRSLAHAHALRVQAHNQRTDTHADRGIFKQLQETLYRKYSKRSSKRRGRFTTELNHLFLSKQRYRAAAPQPRDVVMRICLFRGSFHRKKSREIIVLGSSTLADLIDCPDWACTTDEHVQLNRPNIPGSFFLIGNTFYYDDRHEPQASKSIAAVVARQLCAKKIGFSPLTFDDSETHHKDQDGLSCFKSAWSPPANDPDNTEAHQLSIGDFKLKKMTATRLRSLTVQLGAHYVFFHQGNCEHTFAFVDIREKNEHDSQLPALIFRRKIRRRLCSVCCGSTTKHGSRGKAYAKFVTFDDRLAGQSPCFFCTQCYWDLHYSSRGHRLYEFKVYPYLSDM